MGKVDCVGDFNICLVFITMPSPEFPSGPFFEKCKQLNRARPLKVMGLEKKIIAQYPPHSKKEKKMFHVSISK